MGLADKYNDIYMRLKSFHDTPERLHHDWSHIVACLDELYEVKSFFSERVFLNLFFAILLHDVVYSATAKAGENEAQSAVFADELLKKLDFSQSRIEKIHALILSTANHQGTDIQEQWMGDIDCAVLGMGWERYRRYLQAIRFEYGYFSDKQYREGRLAFLKEMQERRIFQTPYFYEKYEDQAKLNIEKEIEMLEGV
ncbi:MAG: hypothetical protein LBD11_00365 [Candidatus Peribacteria bacterium]|jgi:predicted metal-dependent HD superfamily phosphohydrolase|nr:hypothetical protein [Candidatus Peribacteria bacterium]